MLQKKAYQNIKLHLHVAVEQVSARLKKVKIYEKNLD